MTALSAALKAHATLPRDAPMGMPGAFYTDRAQFDLECATLLSQSWHCVARADELPNQGDYLTLTLLGEPVLLVRDQGQIKALSNVCRHRGMPLAEGQGHAKRFVCSYHGWTYGTDGALLRAPRMAHGSFDQASCRLPEIRVTERAGFVSLCLDPNTPEPDLPGLDALLAPYQTEQFRTVHAAQEVWGCNWKCLVENFMEGYHLSVVHPQTLHGYTPTGLSRKLPSGHGFTAYAANYPDDIPSRGQGAPGLSVEERQRSTLFAVFPTHVASQAATLLASLMLLPEAVDATRVRWTLSVYGDDLDADTIAQRIALWEEVNREDREKLERLQVALRSRHATAGPLAPEDYEGTIRDFHRWMADQTP